VKKISIWCLIGFVLLQIASAARSRAQTIGGAEKAVAALEERWLQSQKTNDPDLVAPLLADNFVSTSSDGKVFSKAEFLATQKTIKWSSAENSDLKVTVFGDTAIATGNEKLKGTNASSKPLDLNERWTDTWVKMASGKWQCIATHQSSIKM
jgi:ketosteroid isomerase-like protein